jgi:hypothetical protein
MILNFEDNHDINAALFIMATISPKAKESIELELYRASNTDESNQQYVLEDAFSNLIKDLESIGLTFSIDYSNYCESMGLLFSFLRLNYYLLPSTLYETIRTDSKIKDLLTRIIQGDLGDNETPIEIYLSELVGLDGQIPIVPELTDFVDQIYTCISQNDIFTDYLRNLLQLTNEERFSIESDPIRHLEYTIKIKDIIGRLSDAVNLFENYNDYDKLCRLQNLIIRDFTAPTNFIEYSYILLETEETIPEDLVDRYIRKRYRYDVSHIWNVDYYILRKLPFSQTEAIMMLCFAYAMHPLESDYLAVFNKVNDASHIPAIISDNVLIAKLYQE